MRLSKIQKFLKESNINYEIVINTYHNTEFGEIRINDTKTNYKTISEITGNRGSKVSGIMVFYKDIITNKSTSNTFTSQNEVIKRLKKDIKE